MQICFSRQSNGDASMQMQELAQLHFDAKKGMGNLNANANFVRLHDKNNWHGCTTKTSVENLHAKTSASIVPLQQPALVLLNYQDKASTTLKSSTGNSIIVS